METDVLESKNSFNKPVPPCASGEGPPYAPRDWPNPGDVWTWKVGNKISPAGYYIHRSLIVPKRLQKTPTRKIWLGSKKAVGDFIKSEFPKADIDAFFASFIWEIPAEKASAPKLKQESSTEISTPMPMPHKESMPKKESRRKQKYTPNTEAELGSQIGKRTRNSGRSNPGSTPKNEAEPVSQIARRTRNSANSDHGFMPKEEPTPKNEGESGSSIGRKTRNSAKRWLSDQGTDISKALAVAEGVSAGQPTSGSTALENNCALDLDVGNYTAKHTTGKPGSRRKRQDKNSQMNNITAMTSEDFDNYLNSLDDIISQSVPQAPPLDSSLLETDEDFARAREELSSLVSQDLSSLITSDKLPLVTNLSSRLRSDPDLSLEELSMLDLILEIPLVSSHLMNAKQVKEEANKFFADLDTNIALVSKLRSKYMLTKDKIAVLQAENASNSPTIQEIDEQIAKLQARRDVLAKAVEENDAQIGELSCTQKRILNSLPKIVNEVQIANTEKSEWEAKQKEAARQEAQILEKFAPLEGFSFMH